jgi:ABC-2 type transport system ATP-binding protein
MSAETVIEARALVRRFGSRVAVAGVDLDIVRGEIFGCLGPNGSGKSTLMRMLLGLLLPSSGSVRVLGHEIPRESERLREKVGYMTQRFSLYEELSIEENLEFCGQIFGLPPRMRRARVEEVIEEAGLAPFRSQRAGTLSGGWKQRLALGASTLHRPELLVLDEPTAGVDPQSRRSFWERLFGLAAEGTTVFVSTHYMDEAVRCHRLCVLDEGRRAALGTPSELAVPLEDRVVELLLEDAERAVVALRDEPWVESTTQLGDSVHVLLRQDAPRASEAAPELARRLERRDGIASVRSRVAQPNMEDVFVAILQGEVLGS